MEKKGINSENKNLNSTLGISPLRLENHSLFVVFSGYQLKVNMSVHKQSTDLEIPLCQNLGFYPRQCQGVYIKLLRL